MFRQLPLIGVMATVIAVTSACDNPMNMLMANDATKYATKVAATVQARPECQQFKDEIMSFAKGSPYNGKITTAIVATKERANKAGCGR